MDIRMLFDFLYTSRNRRNIRHYIQRTGRRQDLKRIRIQGRKKRKGLYEGTRAVENHGTPAGQTPTPMANDKGKGKGVDPEEESRDMDSIGCPSDAFVSVPAAGVLSTFGTADATCNASSKEA